MSVLHSSSNARKERLQNALGGTKQEADKKLHDAVNRFYDRLVADERLKPFFANAQLEVLKWHQFNMMSLAFCRVQEDVDIAHLILSRHKRLFDMGLNETHFDVLMVHFASTLRELDVEQDAIDDAVDMLSPIRPIFVQGAAEAVHRKQNQKIVKSLRWAALLAVVAVGVARFSSLRRMHRK
jgi:hemoglobin